MSNPIKCYDFTAHKIEPTDIKILLVKYCEKWAFQQEKGEETGAIHLQGRLWLKVKERETGVRKKFPGCHLSPTNKIAAKNAFYVMKEDTRIAGPWTSEDAPDIEIPDDIKKITKLLPWQQQILDDANIYNDRIINIVINKTGNIGKTKIVKYADVYGTGTKIPFTNDIKDIMRMVMNMPPSKLYLIDMPKALKKDHLCQFFSGIEEIKNGYAYDDRYKFRKRWSDCPNIWIFTNTEPDTAYLSLDRWKLWTVMNSKLVPYVSSFAPEHSPEIQDFEDHSEHASPSELIDYASLDNIKSDEEAPPPDVFTFPDGSIDDFDWDAPSKTE